MDQPEHRAHRALVQQAFAKRSMERWEPEIVAPVIDALIDAFIDNKSADLVNELTFRFPIRVIAGILGLSTDEVPEFHTWAIELLSIRSDPPRGLAASRNLRDYFAEVLAERRKHPSQDMITSLAQAELDGDRLTDEAIYSFLLLLLPAGAETTFRSSSNLLFGLLTHTDQLDAAREDRALIPRAIDEGIRWEGPITIGTGRLVTRDTVLGGVELKEGSLLDINVASANHDDSRWDNPDEFDIHRPPLPHLAFSSGPHVCLGMHLARMETAVMLNRLFDRLPGLRLDPQAPIPQILGHWFRAPSELRVVFD
jgi:cytochrome P450